MPTPRAGFHGVGIVGDNIYVMGGLDSSGSPSAADEVYNIASNSLERRHADARPAER